MKYLVRDRPLYLPEVRQGVQKNFAHVGKAERNRILTPLQFNIYKSPHLAKAKEEIYKTADILTIHTPLNEETLNLVNRNNLYKMKSSAFLINTARGPIVNQEDLKEVLKRKKISGAAIDVYEEEPPSDTELLRLSNLICTPHIGGSAYEAVLAMGRSAINHLREYFNR